MFEIIFEIDLREFYVLFNRDLKFYDYIIFNYYLMNEVILFI